MKIIRLKNETTGEEKEIQIPAGFDYDKIITRNKSFKDYDGSYEMSGFAINDGIITELNGHTTNYESNKDIFATKELAESALALAQLGQIIEHDAYLKSLLIDKSKTFNFKYNSIKKVIIITYYYLEDIITYNYLREMRVTNYIQNHNYLVFRINDDERDCDVIKKFIDENEDLIRKYLMI